ncbi:MAG: hypothetical protein KJ971_01695 [Firmicutes bacterium]|nr:hypothetical protein [Bacillota bacterium]
MNSNLIYNPTILWLLSGDKAIAYQVKRDLLDFSEEELTTLKNELPSVGWIQKLIHLRNDDTFMWGEGIYSPKWISTHYTLLELLNMGVDATSPFFKDSSELLLNSMWENKGKVRANHYQDMCVCAMILSITTNAHLYSTKLFEIVDYILLHQYVDGGWNCAWQKKDIHSSLHTTICVLEAFRDYEACGYTYRLDEIKECVPKGIEFMLRKKLFRSERTKEIIHPSMLMLSYPSRWFYNTLRALEYLASIHFPYDIRLKEALIRLLEKKNDNNRWLLQNNRVNKIHFVMEKQGKESRWNTLRILRIFKWFIPEEYELITQ